MSTIARFARREIPPGPLGDSAADFASSPSSKSPSAFASIDEQFSASIGSTIGVRQIRFQFLIACGGNSCVSYSGSSGPNTASTSISRARYTACSTQRPGPPP